MPNQTEEDTLIESERNNRFIIFCLLMCWYIFLVYMVV
jgi:hypothetical protein